MESLESGFNQDLNGDGVTGLNPLIIQTDTNAFGSTSLAQIGNNYFLYAAGGTTGPELQYNGAAVQRQSSAAGIRSGQCRRQMAMRSLGEVDQTGLYTVWTTDSNGNYTGNLIGTVSGNSYALESLEPLSIRT